MCSENTTLEETATHRLTKQDRCLAIVQQEKVGNGQLDGRGPIVDRRIKVQSHHTPLRHDFFFVRLKESLKSHATLYYYIVKIISPLSAPYMPRAMRKRLLKSYLDNNATVVNIGSGNTALDPRIINVDLFAYDNVDIVSDATDLCLKDDVADFVLNESTLEHIYDYKPAVKEAYRILRKGGKGYFNVPFMVGFHASPNDFHRFTHEGLKRLFEECGFRVDAIGVLSGAASSFLWITIELLAISLSCGWRPLYQLWYFAFMGLLFPLKFFDLLLNRIPFSKNIAATFYVIASK